MPYTLLDYFPDDYLVVLDESHQTVPQLHGQYEGDKSRKDTLVDHGFRLPSAMDNRPLRFDEFVDKVNQVVFLSATPSAYEIEQSTQVVEQIVRPTGLIDPEIIVKPTKGQIDDLVARDQRCGPRPTSACSSPRSPRRWPRTSPSTCSSSGIRVRYLHSEVDTLERVEILRGLRLGEFDVLVGINLLREGLDLPEVSLVAILDADKEGFLRSETVADPDDRSRRPQRRGSGDHVRRPDDRLDAPRDLRDQPAPQEAARVQRRARHRPADGAQEGHRHPRDAARHPTATRRRSSRGRGRGRGRQPQRSAVFDLSDVPPDDLGRLIQTLQDEMHDAATNLRFEEAARLRDEITELKRELRAVV